MKNTSTSIDQTARTRTARPRRNDSPAANAKHSAGAPPKAAAAPSRRGFQPRSQHIAAPIRASAPERSDTPARQQNRAKHQKRAKPVAGKRVALRALAKEWAVSKDTIWEVVKKLGIAMRRLQLPDHGRMSVMTITQWEAGRVKRYLEGPWQARRKRPVIGEAPGSMDEVGWFYIVRLEPLLEPERVKLGFTTSLEIRMRHHRCATPFVECVKAWLCRRSWERTVTHCVARGCERLHTEVYRARSVSAMVRRGDDFFARMPSLTSEWRQRNLPCTKPEPTDQ